MTLTTITSLTTITTDKSADPPERKAQIRRNERLGVKGVKVVIAH